MADWTFTPQNPAASDLPQSNTGTDAQVARYRELLAQGMSEEDAINQVKAEAGIPSDQHAWTDPAPAPPPDAGPVAGGAPPLGGSGATDNPFAAWSGSFTPPTAQALPDAPTVPGAPQFNAPSWSQAPAFSYRDFVGPTADEAMQSPGYQFRLGQGTDRLQNAASARGTLNDSGTLKALMDYGQDAASQEYANVWKRDYDQYATNRGNALDTYNTNYKTQYVDPYTASYQAAKDQFAPQMSQYDAQNQMNLLGYQTGAANTQHLNDTANTNAWNDYLLGWQDYEARRNTAANFALGS
jgi:hypothetical protein